jgi:hypothetical protein
MQESRFVILGIHDELVTTVNDYHTDEQGRVTLVKENNVARVRMYVNGKEYDEDFDLPVIPYGSGVPKNAETYKFFLTPEIEKRMKELEANS